MQKTTEDSKKEDIINVDLAINGNQDAFSKIMKKYKQSIQSLIYKMVYDKKEVEDLIQEAFIKAFSSLPNYNQQFAFSTWLFRIAINNTIDHLRKKKIYTFSIDEEVETKDGEVSFEIPDSTYLADNDIISEQKQQLLNEAIASLPEKYKQIIELRHVDELSYEDISERMQIPIGTVKANLFRARELLNKYLRKKIKFV